MQLEIEINESGRRPKTSTIRRPMIVIGRSSRSDVQLSGDVVSSRHASLKIYSDGCVVEDLGSSNGTFVNGQRIAVPVDCPNETVIQFGEDGPSIRILSGSSEAVSAVVPNAPISTTESKSSGWLTWTAGGLIVLALGMFAICGIVGASVAIWKTTGSGGNHIRGIEKQQAPLARAVGKVVVGFEGTDSEGKTRVFAWGSGTGFAVSAEGHVFTNQHVVSDAVTFQKMGHVSANIGGKELKLNAQILGKIFDAKIDDIKVWVILDKKAYEAELIHVSDKYDFSILKVTASDLPYFRLSAKDEVPSTAQVFALGFPGVADEPITEDEAINQNARKRIPHYEIIDVFSEDQLVHSVTMGIVSRIKVEENPHRVWVQHDALINKGNSGGPLCTSNGVVVGLNTLGFLNRDTYFSLTVKQLEEEIKRYAAPVKWVNP